MKILTSIYQKIAENKICVIILLPILLFFTLIDSFQESKYQKLFVKISMRSSVNTVAQLFYDTGKGFNEQDAVVISIPGGKYTALFFPLPRKPIQKLRFDPVNRESKFEIRYIRIVDQDLVIFKEINLKSIKPLQQIRSFEMVGKLAVGVTDKGASDPILNFEIDYPLISKTNNYLSYFNKQTFKKLTLVFILTFTGLLFAFFNEDSENDEKPV